MDFGSAVFWSALLQIIGSIFCCRAITPWLTLIGTLLLGCIGVTRLLSEGGEAGNGKARGNLLTVIRTIMGADLVMSLGNVAAGDTTLLALGLAISIPLIIFGSTLLFKFIERFPLIVWEGAGWGLVIGKGVLGR